MWILGSVPARAQCTGSGTTWSCPAGSTSAQVQSAINSAGNGAVITLAAGSYTLSTWVQFSNSAGATLICASVGACTINYTTNQVFGGISFGGINTNFYRISGFVFDAGGSGAGTGAIWFDNASGTSPVVMSGPSGLGGIRIDHNTFQDMSSAAVAIFFGHNNPSGATVPIGNYYGVIDHNTFTNSIAMIPLQYLGYPNPSPPANQLGTVNNLFFENNTINFASMPNESSAACTDGWGGGAYVVRYNTSSDCVWAAHGATHGGGMANYEFYNNTVVLDTNATGLSPIDCYRCFHLQGSGTAMAFNNTFTAPGGKNTEVISVADYRAYSTGPSIDAGLVTCDGTVSGYSYDDITFSDGNTSGGYGYPCWHQPGRDFYGNYAPMYAWNNYWSDTGAEIGIVVPDFGGTPPPSCTTGSAGNCDFLSYQMVSNREWFNAVSASAQTSTISPFNGTTGMGFGPVANRSTTCTTSTQSGAGVGYFATDVGAQGTLYTCSATNVWTVYYVPYTYPHPLTTGGTISLKAVAH